MAKLFSILSLILAIVLFPPAVLAVVSNNAVPGDATYPIKRSLESVILAVVSINPSTRAWFAQERSDRRFSESIVLVSKDRVAAAQTLDELVSQTEVAAQEIEKVQDEVKKEELKKELASAIQKYNDGLTQIQRQLELEVSTPEPSVTIKPIRSPTPRTTSSPQPSSIATIVPTSTPTPIPSILQPISPPPLDSDGIDDIQDKLGKIKDDLKIESNNRQENNKKESKKDDHDEDKRDKDGDRDDKQKENDREGEKNEREQKDKREER